MDIGKLAVLIIEDAKSDLEIEEIILDRAGIIGYDTAQSEQEAIRHFQKRTYNLVISDTMYGSCIPMGPPAVREAQKLGQKPVVVALSSHPDNEKLWEGLSDYFFDKHDFLSIKTTQLGRVLKEKFQI